MTRQDEFRQRALSIEALVSQLENATDPAVGAAARDLVQSLMELHGASLERLLEIVGQAGDPGRAILDRLGRDELVRSVLLLYGLHPEGLRARVAEALATVRVFLEAHGADAELVSIDDEGAVTLGFRGKSGGCGSTVGSLKSALQAAVEEAAPDAPSIVIRDTTLRAGGLAFVALADLETGRAGAALSVPNHPRSGD
jgi:Fe-S cluster biogenesis protein NfuA